MMISDGNGIQADSIAIISKIPKCPVAEMTAMMSAASLAIMFSTIHLD